MLKYIVGDICDALEAGDVDAIGHQAKKTQELDKHLVELDKQFRKLEGRDK